MSASHGCNDDKAVIDTFKEALQQRIGIDRYQLWFGRGVQFSVVNLGTVQGREITDVTDKPHASGSFGSATRQRLDVCVEAAFAAERLKKNFLRELRGAAMQAIGVATDVAVTVRSQPIARIDADPSGGINSQPHLPTSDIRGERTDRQQLTGDRQPSRLNAAGSGASDELENRPGGRRRKRRAASSLSNLLNQGQATRDSKAAGRKAGDLTGASSKRPASRSDSATNVASDPTAPRTPKSPSETPAAGHGDSSTESPRGGPGGAAAMTMRDFVAGSCNQLAHTAAVMQCQLPTGTGPLYLYGPSGTGKTHLLTAIADHLRRRHRMRRVIHLTAEQFTNDFCSSVHTSGLPAFRQRYRDVDALLIDDVHFVASKKATLRELLYTVETLNASGRPLVFSANRAPSEIPGLTGELSGRLAAGLVCSMQPLDASTRETILRRYLEVRCPFPVPEDTVTQLNLSLSGDGRMISGIANLVGTLQRMYQRMPTISELRQFGGDFLRSQTPVVSLSTIERAVSDAFGLDDGKLKSGTQTRAISEPRMLAMYLSRQLTSSAFSDIANHFGGRSHSTAISANKKVAGWLEEDKSIGRGAHAMTTRQALDRIESLLRASG
ncbi:MAG: DnaA/Hda family protein [Planctomycetota bacterium]